MRFALAVSEPRPSAADFARRLTDKIEAAGSVVVGADAPPDMVIAVGGDGTMLGAVNRALDADVPVIGFNVGSLGFLAEAEPEELDLVVDRLISGDYEIRERMTIEATVGTRTVTGVNDVVVEKVDSQRLVELAVEIDGEEFITYRADGVIVATPTGSTAYSFSAGGPLVAPSVDALIMTPVAAHSLFDQSLVLDPEAMLAIEVFRDRPVKVSVDKIDMGHLVEGDRVIVRAGATRARFVSLRGTSFSQLVKSKFDLH